MDFIKNTDFIVRKFKKQAGECLICFNALLETKSNFVNRWPKRSKKSKYKKMFWKLLVQFYQSYHVNILYDDSLQVWICN